MASKDMKTFKVEYLVMDGDIYRGKMVGYEYEIEAPTKEICRQMLHLKYETASGKGWTRALIDGFLLTETDTKLYKKNDNPSPQSPMSIEYLKGFGV